MSKTDLLDYAVCMHQTWWCFSWVALKWGESYPCKEKKKEEENVVIRTAPLLRTGATQDNNQ